MISWGCFKIAAPKALENYQKNRCSGVPFSYSCTNTVYSLLPDLRLLYRYTGNCSFQPCLYLKLLRWHLLWSCFFQKQELTGFLQSNCSKQQLKFARRLADVLEKDFTMDVLICKKLRRAKLKTSKRKIDFLWSRCRCRRQCRCWCRDANAEISNWPTINSPEGLTTMFLLSQ